ncbi:glycosyltransferase [Polynucleobacter sp. 80A-SIGWE]|uniref:glycosyltransferase n=1 Tax=Polynucleobacter sp. 80A-SIGWE TaxID=2689100 RepID=UPI001C0B1137|nr:glycosyltransferase [Polynucleobacter sp. 80A-SIGWE]MBU3589084.1 glycosyltransferase [Polynucleobacter sp. 80A-SIGWE]
MNPKHNIKVLRVVTNPECVSWHMGKTLTYLAKDFDVVVAGERVSINVNQFPDVAWVDIPINRKINLWADLRALIALYFLCRRYKPDIAHSIMPKAGLLLAMAAKFAGIPVRIHTFTGQVWDTKKGASRFLLKLVDQFIVAMNSACLTDSPSQSTHLFNNRISDNGSPLGVLGKGSLIGVDLDRFDVGRIRKASVISRESLGLNESDFVISFVARKSMDKGALDLLRAFADARRKAEHLKLLFIGPDESNGAIEQLRLNQPEIFIGVVEMGLIGNHEEYLAISDVLCVPSYREGFGTVVIDAAALGVPCIGSRIPGLVDSISDGETGLLFPVGNTSELENLFIKLESDRGSLKVFGRAASGRVRDYFSSEVLYYHLKNFYKDQLKLFLHSR